MEVKNGWKKLKYEADVDPTFGDKIASLPGGEKIYACMQCGTCGGTCPISQYMDYTPQKIIAMIRAGFKKEVLTSFTNWLCCSCYSCTVECPKGVKITDIMYALKRCAIQNGIHKPRFAIPILAREFFQSVMKHGRTNETRLTLLLFLKTNPLRLLRQTGLGFKLWRQGRLSYRTESIRNIKQLRRLLKTVERKKTAPESAVQCPLTVEAP